MEHSCLFMHLFRVMVSYESLKRTSILCLQILAGLEANGTITPWGLVEMLTRKTL